MKTLIGGTHTGLVRAANQDRFGAERISDALSFAVLCDGMGGENGGGVAAEMATNHVMAVLRRELAENLGETTLRGILLSALAGANALVYDAAQKDESLFGMGTTMVAAVFSGGRVYLAYVGDSRAYLISPEKESQITRDHTVVQMLVDLGEITEDDAKVHPKRHFITRAVGVSPQVEAEFVVESMEEADIALLCSDGLYNYLTPGEIYPLLAGCVREESVQSLIDLALSLGGSDNVTAIVGK